MSLALLPEKIRASLPFRFFKQNGSSLQLLDMVRATDGNVEVLFYLFAAVAFFVVCCRAAVRIRAVDQSCIIGTPLSLEKLRCGRIQFHPGF